MHCLQGVRLPILLQRDLLDNLATQARCFPATWVLLDRYTACGLTSKQTTQVTAKVATPHAARLQGCTLRWGEVHVSRCAGSVPVLYGIMPTKSL